MKQTNFEILTFV